MEWKRIAVAGIGAVIVAGTAMAYVNDHYNQLDREYESLRFGNRQMTYKLEQRRNQPPEPFYCNGLVCVF